LNNNYNVKKRKLFMSALLLLTTLSGYGQACSLPVGARAIGAGHTGVVIEGFWSVFNNLAAAANIQKVYSGVFIENRYLLPEMNRIAAGILFPVRKGALILTTDHFGGNHYTEMKAGIGYTMPLGKTFSAGIQLDYLLMAIGEGYGSYHAFSFEGGIMARITEKLTLGVHIFNPAHLKWINTEEHIPVIFRGGLSFKPEASLGLFAEVNKSTDNQTIFCVGAEYGYNQKFFVRAGITSGPSRYTFGAGFNIKRIRVDIASSVHAWLGYSPQLSFTYCLEK
jgi:hypothetical protein